MNAFTIRYGKGGNISELDLIQGVLKVEERMKKSPRGDDYCILIIEKITLIQPPPSVK